MTECNLSVLREFVLVAGTVFLAELADKTQLATLGFAATSKLSKLQVWLASSLGLAVASGLAVFLAAWLAPLLSKSGINRLSGLLFVAIGAWMLLRSSR